MQWDERTLPGRFVLWLASEKAAFLKGRFVHANWDTEELEQRRGEIEKNTELLLLGVVGCEASRI